jgi:hypothetical protein
MISSDGTSSEQETLHTDRFPRRDWAAIWRGIEPLAQETDRARLWAEAGRGWLSDLAGVLGPEYRVHDVNGFWLVSNRSPANLKGIGSHLKRARARIVAELDGIAVEDPACPLAILWLEDETRYYEYVSYFYPESGEFAFSGGMFLPGGYPHFVFPHYDEGWQLERVVSHELTHALVRHLPLPLWLNEGLAVTLEEMIAGVPHAAINEQTLAEHRAYWNPESIQKFWSGESFSQSDEGCGLSYALGQLLVLNLGHDFPRFREFAIGSDHEDSGEAAARQVFGIGLGDLIAGFLGEDDWTPRPEQWVDARHDAASPEVSAS